MPSAESSDFSFLPTARIETLKQRAQLLWTVRQLFETAGYWEVETPVLSQESVIDLHLEPFPVTGDFGSPLGRHTCYLQTSPEFCMKRLLAAGADRIYQITKAFRQGEAGSRHNPEFTMLEWYALGDDHFAQMLFVEQLCRQVFQQAENQSLPPQPFLQWTYAEAFQRALGCSVLDCSAAELEQLAYQQGIDIPPSHPSETPLELTEEELKDDWLNLLLAECVEPYLKQQTAVFIYNYPTTQAALAKTAEADPRVAERFELYLHGVELCNGYHELTDAVEFVKRHQRQNQLRVLAGLPALPEQSRLESAMQQPFPPCAGVALGVDRLVMLALGYQSLADVIAFPIAQA